MVLYMGSPKQLIWNCQNLSQSRNQKMSIKIYNDDEELYELISEEIESNNTKKGLWTKAFSESEGDEQKAKAHI